MINDEFKSRYRGKKSSNFNQIFNYINVNFILFRVKTDDSAYQVREKYKMAADRKYYFEHDIRLIPYIFVTLISHLSCVWSAEMAHGFLVSVKKKFT